MSLATSLQGFNPAKVPTAYGDTLTFWDWQKRTISQQIKLGADGLIPLETRFLHEPSQPQGYVGAALSSNVIRFSKVPTSLWPFMTLQSLPSILSRSTHHSVVLVSTFAY